MEEGGTLDKLASDLSLDERKNLLNRLEGQSVISREPLYEEDDGAGSEDIKVRFSRQPWYLRLWLFIISLFKSKPPIKAYQDWEITKIGKSIELKTPGFYNAARGILLPDFYNALNRLKESSRFFYSALESGFNRDPGAFYGFLASLEMERVHTRLNNETGPDFISGQNPGYSDALLRQTAQKILEEAMAEITEEERNVMYADARALVCLKQLSSFLFDRLILAFSTDKEIGGMICTAGIVRDALIGLNNILCSFKEVPSMKLLESLFIFILQEEGKGGDDIDDEAKRLLTRAETSIAAIKDFNRRIPLTKIIRCAVRDPSFYPKPISGGEDWFLLYKDYWKRCLDRIFFAYFGNRRRRELQRAYKSIFKDATFKRLESAETEANPDGLPVKRADSLSFLLTFHSAVFMSECNQFLRPILVDGEFFKKENKLEFTENYNELIKLDDIIKHFDGAISAQGDWGKRYAQVKGEMTSLPVKRRKLQLIQGEIDESAETIVVRTRQALNSMVNVLGGILERDNAGRYDKLSNMPALAGKGTEFIDGLGNVMLVMERAAKILQTIEDLETGQ